MFRIARIAEFHPESNACDIVYLDDGSRLAGIPVMSQSAGDLFGNSGMPDMMDVHPEAVGAACLDLPLPEDDEEKWLASKRNGYQFIIGVIGVIGRRPIVIGFIYPEVSQALFEEDGFFVKRRPNDVYMTEDRLGNVDIIHPSGTRIRISEEDEPRDLEEQDYDKKWKIRKNRLRTPKLEIELRNSYEIDPETNEIVNEQAILDALDELSNCAEDVEIPEQTMKGKITISPKGEVVLEGISTLHVKGFTTFIEATGSVNVTGESINLN